MFSDIEKIPLDRIGVLLGEKGSNKKNFEKWGNVKLTINSKVGTVKVSSKKDNSHDVFRTKLAVKAIGAGFSPLKSQLLFKDNYYLIVINLKDYLDSADELRRFTARIIGTRGKARKTLEIETSCDISIYNDHVGIIGPDDSIQLAERAVEMFLNGAMHSTVYKYIKREKRREGQDAVRRLEF